MDIDRELQSCDQDRLKSKRVYNPPILKAEGRIDEITKATAGSKSVVGGGNEPMP
jgi:hypothetical protein